MQVTHAIKSLNELKTNIDNNDNIISKADIDKAEAAATVAA